MAKFCERFGRMSKCTYSCKACFGRIEVGDKVRYITKDTPESSMSGYFPPRGTIGVVIGVDDAHVAYLIQWSDGIKRNNCRYAVRSDLELVEDT